MHQDLVRIQLRRAGQETLLRAEANGGEAGGTGLRRQRWRGDYEVELSIRIGCRQPSIDANVAPVVERELRASAGATPCGAWDELGEGVVERPDLDDALFNQRRAGVFSGPDPHRERDRAGLNARCLRRLEFDAGDGFRTRKERDDSGLNNGPGGRVTKHLEGELVDDSAGVSDANLAARLATGGDGDSLAGKRGSSSHALGS